MFFVWISEQKAIISLYSINWFVFITDAVCLLRGTTFTQFMLFLKDKPLKNISKWMLSDLLLVSFFRPPIIYSSLDPQNKEWFSTQLWQMLHL